MLKKIIDKLIGIIALVFSCWSIYKIGKAADEAGGWIAGKIGEKVTGEPTRKEDED